MTEKEFIEKIGPLAAEDMQTNGVLASVTIAQACLESGYGSTELAVNANNLFGMKTNLSGNTWKSEWDGKSRYTKKTNEQKPDGTVYSITADFRKYPDQLTSIKDHSCYLIGAMNGKIRRYEGIEKERNYRKAAQIIKNGGYATDVAYVDKLCSLIERWKLTEYDKEETKMSNSALVDCVVKSPNHSGRRTHVIDRITPHCVVGQLSAAGIGGCFVKSSVQASCNYGIGKDGDVCLVVDEENRSWCSSSNSNDQRAVTIECASDKSEPYAMTSAVYEKLVQLCADICKRNGKSKMVWLGDKTKTLNYAPQPDEMVVTVHRWFKNKSCPGDWLYSRLGELVKRVNALLGSNTEASKPETGGNGASYKTGQYKVNVELNIRKGPGTNYDIAGKITDSGVYTIVEIQNGSWGCLKSGAGWINVGTAYCTYQNEASGDDPSGEAAYRVDSENLNMRKGPGTSYDKAGFCPKGTYTIVETKQADGYMWGRLKSGAGWIALKYAVKL